MNIKKILVPTDFSNAANNALLYAADMAAQYEAALDIVHAYLLPVLTARGNPVLLDPAIAEANRQAAEAQLEETKKLVSEKHPIQFTLTAIPIYWQMELAEAIHNRHADLIVTGATGASGLAKTFIGSNAARIIQNAPTPVLVVPEKVRLSQLNKIGLAYDGLELKEVEKLSILNSFKQVFKASIHVFQFINNKQTPSPHLAELIEFLSGSDYKEIDESEVAAGILKCIEINHLDMIVMIPRKRGFFHNLLSGSMTENVSYQISIPLLAIPE